MKTLNTVLDFIVNHWEAFSAVLIWILVRVIPTKNNLEIVDGIMKLLNALVPNKKIDGGTHDAKANAVKK